jgi:hypothetical protein
VPVNVALDGKFSPVTGIYNAEDNQRMETDADLPLTSPLNEPVDTNTASSPNFLTKKRMPIDKPSVDGLYTARTTAARFNPLQDPSTQPELKS